MIGAATLFFSVIHGVQTGALAGFDDFRVLAKVNFLSGLVSFPCILLGAWLGHVPGMIAGLAVSLAIGCIWLQIALNGALHRFGIILQWRGCWAERQVLWHFTLPAALSNMLIAPAMWWGNTMLAKMPNGYAELGTLGVAQQWQTMLLFLPATLQPVLLSNLSNTNPHEREFWRMIRLAFVANSAVTGTAALIVSILAKPILGLYGDAFLVGWPTLCLLCFTTVLISTINVIGAIIASSMTMWWGFLLNLLWAIAFVTFSTFWVQYGHFGWASAFFCSYVCHLAWTSWFLLYKSKSPVSPYTS
jgi:O-antigen/teichoic acid export membrane protein